MQRNTLFIAGLLAVSVACSSDSDVNTTVNDALVSSDVANISADATTEDVDMMAGMDGSIGGLAGAPLSAVMYLAPPTDRPGTAGCSFGSGRFTCPPIHKGDLTVTRTVTYLDAAGASQAAYDALTTASVHVVADVTGGAEHGNWSGDVSRHRDFTVSGLAGTETTRTINGTGTESVSRSHVSESGNARSFDLTGSSSAVNVVIPVRAPGVDPWPLSGVVTRTYTVTMTGGPHDGESKTRTVVITFNGTSTPDATVNGEAFTIDLAARAAHRKNDHE